MSIEERNYIRSGRNWETTRRMTREELAHIGKHVRQRFRQRYMTEDGIKCWLNYWARFKRGDR